MSRRNRSTTVLGPCAKRTVYGKTCLQRFAGGWIDHTDLCPRCTTLLMSALESASPESLTWHPNFAKRAGGEVR